MDVKEIDVNGPVYYLEWDGPAEGPTFLLVHGLGGSRANWLGLAPLLAKHGRVLAPDLAGFGHTPIGKRSATVEGNARLVREFARALDAEPAIVVGNSMGGLISCMVAARDQDLVAGLVLIDPAVPRARGVRPDPVVAAVFAAYMIPKVGEQFVTQRLRRMGPERLVRETLQMCCVDPDRVDPAVREALVEIARARADMPWSTTGFLQAARSLVRTIARRERYLAMIRQISAPTLLIMGRHDRLVQLAAAEAIAQTRADWEFVVFDDLGHVPQMEDPQAVAEAIERWMRGPVARALGDAPAGEASA